MSNIDVWFIRAGLLYVLAGMGFGIWMGINAQFQFSNFHAHVNLVGFVMMVLYGLIHSAWPALRGTWLAGLHFWLHIAGSLVLVYGKYLVGNDPADLMPVAAGSLLTLAATLLFAVLFFVKVPAPSASREAADGAASSHGRA